MAIISRSGVGGSLSLQLLDTSPRQLGVGQLSELIEVTASEAQQPAQLGRRRLKYRFAQPSPAHIVGYREPGLLGFALDSAPVGGGNPQVDVPLFTLFFLTAGPGVSIH